MIPDVLEYLLRLTVIWAVLIAYYFFALRRAGFATQRFYLLGSLAFGLVVPLLPALGGGLPLAGFPSVTYVAEPYFYAGEAATEATGFTWSWSAVLPWLYLAGVAFFAARTLVQWRGLWSWASSGKTDRYDGYRVIRHRGITGPFVAFGWIFLPAEMSDADLEYTALIHEAAHLRARHHYDTLLLTIVSLLLWFHPLFWMLRRLLATVHEYEADAVVIQRVPVRTYGLQLLKSTLMASSTHAPDLQLDSLHGGFVSKILIWLRPNSGFAASPPQQTTGVEGQVDESISPSGPAGYPGLFSSPITKRITMITSKNRARKLRILPLITLCLLLAGLLVACSGLRGDATAPSEDNNIIEEVPADAVEAVERPVPDGLDSESYRKGFAEGKKAAQEANEKIAKEFAETVYREITYPAVARSAGETGTFDFIIDIDETGLITNATYSKEGNERDPVGEITVVGVGKTSEAKAGTSDALVEEVLQTLNGLQLPAPYIVMDMPMPMKLPMRFNFLLEE